MINENNNNQVKKNFFKELILFYRLTWVWQLILFFAMLGEGFLGYLISPIMRNQPLYATILSIVAFTLIGIGSFFLAFYISKKEQVITNHKHLFTFVIYFFNLLLSGVILTIVFVIIRNLNSTSYINKGAFESTLFLTIYFVGLGAILGIMDN